MKKCLLCVAASLLAATLSTPLAADNPGPTCGSTPDSCQKPGVRVLVPVNQDNPGPTCGSTPDSCQKPGQV